MNMPSITQHAANFTEVEVGLTTFWFSYTTVIAFHHPKMGTFKRENNWSKTTGKHLNQVANMSCNCKTLDDDAFFELMNRATRTVSDPGLVGEAV